MVVFLSAWGWQRRHGISLLWRFSIGAILRRGSSWVARRARRRTKLRMLAIVTCTARALRKTPESIATPVRCLPESELFGSKRTEEILGAAFIAR